MWIKKIKIKNFRNYEKEEINLEKNINIFYGQNAQGKTNIIESIFLCSLGKSFRAKKDNEMIKLNEQNAMVEIEYEKSDREGKIKIEIGNKKNIYLNGIKIKKLSELLGNLNIVIFTPDDINILKGFAVAKLDSDDRILDLEEKPENPKSDIGVYATYLYPKFVINEIANYLKEGNKPDAPGYLVEYLYKKYPVYAYKFEGNCYDVGTFDSLNLVREKYNKK